MILEREHVIFKSQFRPFWVKFRNSYLPELREHHIYQNRKNKVNDDNSDLKLGDVVIVKDDKIIPRCLWRVARVDDLVLGNDHKVRGDILSTISPDGTKTKISRPIQKIIPLEVTDNARNYINPKISKSAVDCAVNNENENESRVYPAGINTNENLELSPNSVYRSVDCDVNHRNFPTRNNRPHPQILKLAPLIVNLDA